MLPRATLPRCGVYIRMLIIIYSAALCFKDRESFFFLGSGGNGSISKFHSSSVARSNRSSASDLLVLHSHIAQRLQWL